MLIEGLVPNLFKALAANSTATAFAVLADTLTKPAPSTTRCVLDMGGAQLKVRNELYAAPFGGNDNNDTFSIRISGWNKDNQPNADGVYQWSHSHICTVACTLSSALTGVANGTGPPATNFYCDTLSLTSGIAVITSGTGDLDKAWFVCDVGGFELVEVTFDLTTGGDSANAMLGYK